MASPVLQFKRGNIGAASTIPALRPGEPAFTLDKFDLFVGFDTSVAGNKFFGSHRYWEREDGNKSLKLRLVDKDGTNYVSFKSPDTLTGTVEYILPGTQGTTSSVLTNDGSGNLTWSSGSANPVFTGIATFTDTTDNTLGDANTGSVQLDGGLGINKNTTVGANLNVQGYSEFVGVSTFGSDLDINASADISTDLTVGQNLSVTGVSTFSNNLDINASADISTDLTVGQNLSVTGVSTFTGSIDANGGADISGQVSLNNDFSVTGVSTFTGSIDANGGLDVLGHSELDNVNVSGIATIQNLDVQSDFDIYASTATFHNNVIVDGNLTVNGVETIINTTTLTVQDKEIILGVGTNGSPNDSSASGGGVSIASTEGNPLVDFYLVGIHTHPNTYKDIVWIRADDLGVGTTDSWHFNYAVGIGSTQVLDGVRLAVTNTQITDDTLSTPQINVSSASTIGGLLDVNGGLDVTGQVTLNNNLLVSGISTFTGAIDVNGGGTIDNIQIGVTGDNEIDTSSGNLTIDSAGGTTTIDDELIVSGDVRINGNDIKASDGNANITLTSNTLTAFAGDIRVNGNDIQASDGNVNITMTSNTLTEVKGDLKVTGNDIQSSTATALTLSGANVTVAGELIVGGNDIKASDGKTALTLADSTGAVTAASDLTVQGNLYVSGNTTQVNTAALTVEDRTIDLGIVNGAAPASSTTWDLGVLFNYYTGGAAKKSAVVWEHADTRFKFASVLGADTNGSDNDTPQLSVTTFAPIEIGALWVTDCAGTSQVISCTGTERFLENITVDAGTF